MVEITLQSKVKRDDSEVLCSELGNELVVMNLLSGNYIGLNAIASSIWREIAEEIIVDDLIARLTQRFDVDQLQCSRETLTCLEALKAQQLLVVF